MLRRWRSRGSARRLSGVVRGLHDAAGETLRGTDGGEWLLCKEVTWQRFKDAMHAMPKGKAVGADGFSIELLVAAGEEVQKELFHSIVADLEGRRVPEEWRKVVYALLLKPPPNDPDLVSKRREIALMSQAMKLLLAVVRQAAYRRLLGRVSSEQMGWLPGYGCVDVSLTIALRVPPPRQVRVSVCARAATAASGTIGD